jgi:uncharacterized membrane protein (DUF2068 family)
LAWFGEVMSEASESNGIEAAERGRRRGAGIRTVALFEAGKGVLVLLVGIGALALLHANVQSVAEELVRHFHLNPAHRYPRIFLHLAEEATHPRILLLSVGAAVYAVMRFVEAYGLWRQQQWAAWFGIASSGIYIPIELRAVLRGVTWPEATLLIVNTAILVFLIFAVVRGRTDQRRRVGE